jgi:uncharacterized protein (DUF1810 family)
MTEPYDLARFVEAQAGCIDAVERELRAGRKASHWMWFVFPQLRGLGKSAMAERYAITSLAEATAYTEHPLLGTRLRDHTRLVTANDRSVAEIFGFPDHLKFHSCLTLFARTPKAEVFLEALSKHFAGALDAKTVALLEHVSAAP